MEGEPETVTEKDEGRGDGEVTEEKEDGDDKAVVLPEGEGDKGEEGSGEGKPEGEDDKDVVEEKVEEGRPEGEDDKDVVEEKAEEGRPEGKDDKDVVEEKVGEGRPEGEDDKDVVEEKVEGVNEVEGSGKPGSEEDKEGEVDQKQEEGDALEGVNDRTVEDNSPSEAKRVSATGRMSILQEEPEEGVSEVTLLVTGEDSQLPSHIRDLQSRAMSISKSRRLSGEHLY